MFARVRMSRHGDDLAIGLLLLGLPVVVLSFVSSEAAAIALLAVVGLGVTVVDVAAVTLLQRDARGEILPHALGLLQTVFVAGVGVGTLLAPVLVAALGVRHALLVTGAILPVLAAALGRRLRRLDDRPAVDTGRLALLAAIPIFRPLPEASLEALTRSLASVEVAPGAMLFEQGDEGDAFYVVEDGEAEIWQDGVLLNEHRPGGYFGEIALLRDIPRIATVRARTALRLLKLDRATFLATVTGNRTSSEAADAVVGARLGPAPNFGAL